jgi:glycosyltransferase involved in cell wall biosynthesis
MSNFSPTGIVCIVPAMNEGSVIYDTVTELVDLGLTVLCVNDCSSDDTLKNAQEAGALIVSHSLNLGQGAALETGFEIIRRGLIHCDYVATFDADGQHVASDLLRMKDILDLNPKIMVTLGSRFLEKNDQVPLLKKIMLKSAARIGKLTYKLDISDRHNGIRLFRKEFLSYHRIDNPGYGHADEFLDTIHRCGLRFEEVPVTINYSVYSRSKGQPMINAIRLIFDKWIGVK